MKGVFFACLFLLAVNSAFSQGIGLTYSNPLKTHGLSPDEVIRVADKNLALRFKSGESTLRFIDNSSLVLDCTVPVTVIVGKSIIKDIYRYRLSVNIIDDLTCELVADEYTSMAGTTVSREIADSVAEDTKSKKKQQYYREMNKQIYDYLELNYQVSRSGLDLALTQAKKARQ